MEKYLKKDLSYYNEKIVIKDCFSRKYKKENKFLIENFEKMEIPEEFKQVFRDYLANPDPFLYLPDFFGIQKQIYENKIIEKNGFRIFKFFTRKTPVVNQIIKTNLFYINGKTENYFSKNKFYFCVSTENRRELVEKIKKDQFIFFKNLLSFEKALEKFYG